MRIGSMAALVVAVLVGGQLSGQAASAEREKPVTCHGQIATIVGTPGKDRLDGTDGPDVIAGLGGNDRIRGLGGDDVICGGKGADTIDGGDGDDQIWAGDNGRVPLFESDPIAAGDTVTPGPGDDYVNLGFNTIGDGAYELDHLMFDRAAAGVTVDLAAGTATGEGTDTLVVPLPPAGSRAYAVEVQGSSHADVLLGTDAADELIGNGGGDHIEGRGGSDLILDHWDEGDLVSDDFMLGGPGADAITAGGGADVVRGGPGPDTLDDVDGDLDGVGGVHMWGNAGKDRLSVGLELVDGQVVDGGPGRDTVSFYNFIEGGLAQRVDGIVDLGAGDTRLSRGGDSWHVALTSTEVLFLPYKGFWEVLGTDADERVTSFGGKLNAWMGAGDDAMVGTTGKDLLDGGPGKDRADGGPGKDACPRVEHKTSCES
ncbi:MAG: hypothetical protein KDB63_15570 [Nocardioidaceae bacterium]|nr:hypothetical protein [Nocardioidaceae bacterium]